MKGGIEQYEVNKMNGVSGVNKMNKVNGVNKMNGISGVNKMNGVSGVNKLDGFRGIKEMNRISGVNKMNGFRGIQEMNGVSGVNKLDGTGGLKEMKVLFILLFVLVFCGMVLAVPILSEPSMCCEKSKAGAWCINEPEEKCDLNYRKAPASCDATSYCKLGTCYDSSEGICYENTPQRVCEEKGGTWDFRDLGEVPVCQLGCCLISDQAAFVPLVRCKKLSTYFGVLIDYRDNIFSEMECIVLANSQDMGACVYDKENERTCEFTTRGECGADESVEAVNAGDDLGGGRKFYKNYLCSAEELNTVCARQAVTGCYNGRVFWYDSCGNKENVFFSDKEKSWNNGKLADPDDICPPSDGSDPNCGNCDYMLGSRCEAEFAVKDGERAFCQRTDCVDRWGDSRMNGESWCVNDGKSGDGLDKVGSRYYREVCIDGEVRVESCADYRNEVCYESYIGTSAGEYAVAACRVNRWQACIGITDENQCLNGDKRDCMWLLSPLGLLIGGAGTGGEESGFNNPSGQISGFSNPTSGGGFDGSTSPLTGNAIFGNNAPQENETTFSNRAGGVCVPEYPPGLLFWKEGSSESVCGLVSGRCVVEYTKKGFGSWKCTNNCECLDEPWAVEMNRVCTSQGDCGAYVNYIGKFTDSGYEWLSPGGKNSFSGGGESIIKGGFGLGEVVKDVGSDYSVGSISQELARRLNK